MVKKTNTCECGKPSVYFRRNENRHYCKRCFCQMFEKRVRKTVSKYKLIDDGDRIAVGVSGGKDSATVLYQLCAIAKRRRNVEIVAFLIDEGIKGYRDKTVNYAKQLCEKLGIELKILSFKETLGKSLDTQMKSIKAKDSCTYCGVARRLLLNKAARELRATKLAVGHNLDDEAQVAIMNYLRGDLARAGRVGAKTQAQKRKQFIPRIKPLRFSPEKEVALYAYLKGLHFSDDRCPYATGIRFDIQEFLNSIERKYPGSKFSLVQTYDKIQPTFRELAKKSGSLQDCQSCGEPSAHEICKTCSLWKN